MQRTVVLGFVFSALALGAHAQATGPGQTQPAPVVRGHAGAPQITSTEPVAGLWVRSDAKDGVQTVSTGTDGAEIRLTHGRATVEVHHPAANSQLTVDLPGGQVDLLKDGVYTFNAESNTVRVLHGEADAYSGMTAASGKGVKVKEEQQLSFAAGANSLRAVDSDPRTIGADLIPNTAMARGYAGGERQGYAPYGAPYGDGLIEYPSAPFGYPYLGYGYGWGSPFGWGYPYGLGLGFGYGYGLGYGGFGGFGGYGGFGGFGGGRGYYGGGFHRR